MGGLIHVGAWEGLEYRETPPPLLLFEPQAAPFKALQANCPQAVLVNAACASKPGEATMHTAALDHSSSLLTPAAGNFVGTETVKLTTLDATMEAYGLAGFDVLRIDTQGYELEVLKGAARTLEQIQRVEIELHDPNVYLGAAHLEDLDRYLAPLGFERTGWDTEGSDDLGDATYAREQT